MTAVVSPTPLATSRGLDPRAIASIEAVLIPVGALVASAVLFSLFLLALGKSPATFFSLVWTGGFGSAFSIQNSLQRAAPLILTGLAFATPARIGLTLLGAEGALVLGGFSSAAIAIPLVTFGFPAFIGLPLMALAAMLVGGVWIGLAGWLRHYRGVNETISSLLLGYIAIAIMNFFVEGLLRDPASANKPSTMPIGDAYRVGSMPGTSVHWGLAAGLILAVVLYILMTRTTFGFAARMTGGNVRAAKAQGLPVGFLVVTCCAIAGACAGLAGAYLSLVSTSQWLDNMTAGRGWIALALVVFATWLPWRLAIGALLFGAVTILGFFVQGLGVGVPAQLLSSLPYVVTIAALVVISTRRGKARADTPACLGQPFVPDR